MLLDSGTVVHQATLAAISFDLERYDELSQYSDRLFEITEQFCSEEQIKSLDPSGLSEETQP